MKSSNWLYSKHLEVSGSICLAFGAVLGQFIEWTFFSNTNRLNSSPWVWQETSILKTFIRVLITLVAMLVFPLIGYFVKPTIDTDSTSGLILSFFLTMCLFSVLMGVFIFGFLRVFFHLVKLDNTDAVGKEFEPRSSFMNLTEEAQAD